jgi:hypothetical protein
MAPNGSVTFFNDFGRGNGTIVDSWGNVTWYSGGLRPRPVFPVYQPYYGPTYYQPAYQPRWSWGWGW